MKNKFLKYMFIALIPAAVSSCTKFDDSYYQNPNKPTEASGTQLIANAQLFLPSLSSSAYGVHYPQYLSLTTYTDNTRFLTKNFDFETWYVGPLMNLEEVLKKGETLSAVDGPVVNQIAIAKILKAFFLWNVTDRWGDVPMSEAFKGIEIPNPKYDKQEDIYKALFKLLDEANTSIVLTNGTIKNDIIYKGDMSKWKKLANSIHMLMALRLSKVNPTLGKSEFAKAYQAGGFSTMKDNFSYPHLNQAANQNFWYNSFSTLGRKWYALSKPLVDQMAPFNDPRLSVYGDSLATGGYAGLEFGKAVPNPDVDIPKVSLLGSKLRAQDAPVHLTTYAQLLLAQAEAAKLGWLPGGDAQAKTWYDEAIKQSILQWTDSDEKAEAYLEETAIAYQPAKALEQIATQRWIHVFPYGYEGWAEWRRTGFPKLMIASDINNGKMPRRDGYPVNEAVNNKASYDAAVSAFPYGGEDNLDSRVWWDKP
ncbi:SusD/RagB family nutrient-binding outer membrane lipoprotein [Sphingobacterium sp. DK4209]|uniref:SusD/RagB family nutrient-binding outer membrane lipoprotein n=1 Tax=Sphingobacterium zhuxiongii TaxID=2662364 RepID=A0A5Q0QEK6_9SPHI|nr:MULTISPECIES: SusD/RagB family nutrient-binding outer membrane lipoprotein [unclassified Sphingobacterium]MVZ64250.1 SusD/RagB family nutrient-binding outer membrane lipoprotein [Sphingobacterium sp. DK4209]QGA25600.1 SusD/RagB family nutrient-binding outer membrane lipoprotein [Sphingobacterium sp. dk4302]